MPTGERVVIGYLLPSGGPAWSAVTLYASDDLEVSEVLGIEPQIASSSSEGDLYEAIDPLLVGDVGVRHCRAEFLP